MILDTLSYIDIVFDGPPDRDGPRFIEVEDSAGKGIKVGEWISRPDGHWALRISGSSLSNQALADVASKRHRQVSVHGWTPKHDDDHIDGEIARAAISYIQAAYQRQLGLSDEELCVFWPWDLDDGPNLKQPLRELLVNAAALLIADIERLDRAG